MSWKRGGSLVPVCDKLSHWLDDEKHSRTQLLALIHQRPVADSGTITIREGSDLWLLVESSTSGPKTNAINYYPASLITDAEWDTPADMVYLLPIELGGVEMAYVQFLEPVDCPLGGIRPKGTFGFFVKTENCKYSHE